MIINVKVNSLNTSIFGTTPVKDGLSVVPSYLMKTPSTDFAIEKDRISNTGIFALASTNTYDSDTITSTITLTALEGYFQSTIGKHYLKIRENAILDLVGFEDGEYILSLELVFVDGGDTELNFHINPSSDPIIGEKLANITISTYEITNFTLVPVITIEQSLRDKLDTYNRNEVDVNIAELESQLITLIQNIATSNAQGQFGAIYDPVIEISPTPVTLTFDVEKQSTDTTLFEINTDNTFTFKDVGDFNYVSSVTFQSEGSQSVLETVTFSVVNTDDESVILTNAKDINISGVDTATIQFNTLFNIPSGTTFPLNVRIDVVSTGSDYTINSLTSILMSSNNVGLIASAQGITFDSETSRLTKTNVQEAIKEVADTSALLGGKATQTFKVATAVNDDEAIPFGQFKGSKNGVSAWVNFDGRDGTIRDGFNVANVVRNDVGFYRVEFLEPLDNTIYAVSGSARYPSNKSNHYIIDGKLSEGANIDRDVAYVHISTIYGDSDAEQDCETVSVVIHGGKN